MVNSGHVTFYYSITSFIRTCYAHEGGLYLELSSVLLLEEVMASEVQLDALPYVDQGYDDPGVRESVS